MWHSQVCRGRQALLPSKNHKMGKSLTRGSGFKCIPKKSSKRSSPGQRLGAAWCLLVSHGTKLVTATSFGGSVEEDSKGWPWTEESGQRKKQGFYFPQEITYCYYLLICCKFRGNENCLIVGGGALSGASVPCTRQRKAISVILLV